MRILRIALGSIGAAVAAYGGLLLAERPDGFVSLGTWLVGGVLLHDAVLAPFVIGLCALGAGWLPARLHRPAVAVLCVWGSITLLAIPVLGHWGAKADNPTLLDRNYVVGWIIIGVMVVLGSLILARTGGPSVPTADTNQGGTD